MKTTLLIISLSITCCECRSEDSLSIASYRPKHEEVSKRLREQSISSVLICPQLIDGKANPFINNADDKISTAGFGKLTGDKAVRFSKLMGEGNARIPKLTGGVYLDLYILYSDAPYTKDDKLTCYLTDDSASLEFGGGEKGYFWMRVDDELFNLIKKNFVTKSHQAAP